MTPREIVFAALRHDDVPEVPYTFGVEPEVAGRLDTHYGTPDWRKQITPYIQGVNAVDTDFKTWLDDKYVRDGYGGLWRQDMRPWHLEKPPLSEPSLAGYEFPKAEAFYRPEWREKSRQLIAENAGQSFILGNLGWGLFERSWNLRGFENVLVDYIAEPEFCEEVLDNLMNLYLKFVEYTVDLPIDGILFGDDWGDQRGVILGPDRWREFLKPRWAKIYEATHKAGKVVLSHSCGSVVDIIPDLIEIGLDCLESCQPEAAGMNPFELKKKFGNNICFWGSLGSQSVIPHGTPAELQSQIARLRAEMGVGGGYIMAPAKPLMPETPTENAVAIFEAFTGATAESVRAASAVGGEADDKFDVRNGRV